MIQIDERESQRIKNEFLIQNISHEIVILKTGDYVLDDCVVERKATADFVRSIYDGRLFNQCTRMVAEFRRQFLIIQGIPFYSDTGIHRNAILGAMASVQTRYNIPICFVFDTPDLVTMVNYLLTKAVGNKDINTQLSIAPIKCDPNLAATMQIPQVSYKKAKLLMDKFKTIGKLLKADSKEIKKIKGIGKTIIYNIDMFKWVPDPSV